MTKQNIEAFKELAHKTLDNMIDEMQKRGHELSCPDICISTYYEGGEEEFGQVVSYTAELVERADGSWSVEEITYDE